MSTRSERAHTRPRLPWGWNVECERCRELNDIRDLNEKWICRGCARGRSAEIREMNRRHARFLLEIVALALIAMAIRQAVA